MLLVWIQILFLFDAALEQHDAVLDGPRRDLRHWLYCCRVESIIIIKHDPLNLTLTFKSCSSGFNASPFYAAMEQHDPVLDGPQNDLRHSRHGV